MNEATKNKKRRESNGDFERFFKGAGIDIGCGEDPVLPDAVRFDAIYKSGDAQILEGIPDRYFDYVHSSHCLEHMVRPAEALQNWWRVLKVGGHLIVTVPDFTLYEHRAWPSRFNSDHKHAFSLLDVAALARGLEGGQVIRVQLNETGYDYKTMGVDQTMLGAQAEIELIVRKWEIFDFWGQRPL